MGKVFLNHIGGTRLFSCAACDVNLTNRSELISTRTRVPLPQGGEPAVLGGAGPRDAHRPAHGARRLLQELRHQARLAVRVRHRGEPEVQRREGDPGTGPGDRERWHRGTSSEQRRLVVTKLYDRNIVDIIARLIYIETITVT